MRRIEGNDRNFPKYEIWETIVNISHRNIYTYKIQDKAISLIKSANVLYLNCTLRYHSYRTLACMANIVNLICVHV